MRGVERVTDDHAFRMPAPGLQLGRDDRRRRRGNDPVRRQRGIDCGDDILLQVGLLEHVLLHEVGRFDAFGNRVVEGQAPAFGAGGKAEPLEMRPDIVDQSAQERFLLRIAVVGADVEAPGPEPGGPAGTDQPRADDGDRADAAASDGFHGCVPISRRRRCGWTCRHASGRNLR